MLTEPMWHTYIFKNIKTLDEVLTPILGRFENPSQNKESGSDLNFLEFQQSNQTYSAKGHTQLFRH
jgi:hypothetical protein